MKDIPSSILKQLNNGELESANVVEWFAIDRRVLLKNTLDIQNRSHYLKPIIKSIDALKKQTANTINEAIGIGLLAQAKQHKDNDVVWILQQCKSDIVRSWGTFMIGKDTNLSLHQKFQKIQIFAKDKHFNVREEAWVALRESVIQNVEESIKILSKWVEDEDENIRRFASEVTRPRGVWCKHIEILKEKPELALPILEVLKADTSKYVRDSVGNWLNDASKTQPDFVKKLCEQWEKESDVVETNYIVKKALRTIKKKVL